MLSSQPVIHQRQFRRFLAPLVEAAGQTPGADRYRKVFPATAHLWTLLLHVLHGAGSLRQTHAILSHEPAMWRDWGMSHWVSFSQLARSSTSRPPACAEALLSAMTTLAQQTPGRRARRARRALPTKHVVALDHTIVTLSAARSPWSRAGTHAGVRVQTFLPLSDTIPIQLTVTDLPTNDRTFLATVDLEPWCGWTIVCDLGYYGHRYLARLQQAEVAFITRLHPQARIAIATQQSVPDTNTPAGDTIVSDAIITLGSPNNRNGAVLPNIRLITSRNPAGVEQRFITDRHDLSAAEVVQLYRERWQIELTFRWLKQELGVIRPLGTSPEAVWLTLVIAVTVAAVLAYLEQHRPAAVSRVAFQRACGMALLMDLCAQDGSPPVPG